MITVPKSITPALSAFCGEISRHRPRLIKSKPPTDAKQSHCFDNVARQIERERGEVVFGWAIWHLPDLYFEAEHHGVWCNREGKLLDVSPQMNDATEILFLPDPLAIYDKTNFRPNIIKPATLSPIAIEFANISNEYNSILNKIRSGRSVMLTPSFEDQRRVNELRARIDQILRTHLG